MESCSKQTNVFGYSILCNCKKCKQSMGVINYFSIISKLLSCVRITTYTHIGRITQYYNQEYFFTCTSSWYCISAVYTVYTLACAQRQMGIYACHCVYICTWYTSGYRHYARERRLHSFKSVVTYQKVLSSLVTCTLFPMKWGISKLLFQLHWSFWFLQNNRYLSEAAAAGGGSCCRSQIMSARSMLGLSELQTASLAKQRPHVQSCTKRQGVWCRRALAWDWRQRFFIALLYMWALWEWPVVQGVVIISSPRMLALSCPKHRHLRSSPNKSPWQNNPQDFSF